MNCLHVTGLNSVSTRTVRWVIHLGKAVERVDMYLRLGYPTEDIFAQLDNLIKHVSRRFDSEAAIISIARLNYLKKAAEDRVDLAANRCDILENIEDLVEVNFLEAVAV